MTIHLTMTRTCSTTRYSARPGSVGDDEHHEHDVRTDGRTGQRRAADLLAHRIPLLTTDYTEQTDHTDTDYTDSRLTEHTESEGGSRNIATRFL